MARCRPEESDVRRYSRSMKRTRWASFAALVAAGAIAAGCGGTSQADHPNQAQFTATSRNKAACEYVLVTWSGLDRGYPKGYQRSHFDDEVGGASSPALRHELSLMQAAVASNDLSEIPLAGGDMVKTCYQLGLSHVGPVS